MLFRGTAVWMQLITLPWAAVALGASPGTLGLIVGLQFLPTLVVSPVGGVIADRLDRGTVLISTQIGSFLQAGILSLLVASDSASLATLAIFALTFGILTAIELPVRQAYVAELVPREVMTSAVSLHATAWNTTRFIGPGLAGACIATLGVAVSFAASSLIAIGVTASMVYLERHRFHRAERIAPKGSVLESMIEGARFAVAEPRIRWALVFVVAGGILGIQSFQTLAPLYVSDSLGLGGGAFGAFMALWGGGAVVAAYVVTLLAHGDRRPWLIGGAGGLAVLLGSLSVIGSVGLAFGVVILLGFFQIALVQNALVTVQVAAPDAMRGRVMGLYTTLFQGTSPFGAFAAGWLAELFGVRGAMAIGAVALGVVVVLGAIALGRIARGGSDRRERRP